MTSLQEKCFLITAPMHKGAVMWSIDIFFVTSRCNTAGRAFFQSTLSDLSINLLRSNRHLNGSHAVNFRHSLSMDRYFPAWRIKLEFQSGKVNIVVNKNMIIIDATMTKKCLNVEVPRDFGKSCHSYWMASGDHRKVNFDVRTTCWWPGTVSWQCHDVYFVIQNALLPVYIIHQWLTGWLAVEKWLNHYPYKFPFAVIFNWM